MKNVFYLSLVTILILVLSSVNSDAQNRSSKEKRNKYRFNAGAFVGANFSQIDGDLFAGFNKRGIRAGIKSMFYLNEKLDITTAISFVQRGSRFELVKGRQFNSGTDRYIHLDYIELPLFLTIKKLDQSGRGSRLNLGGSFGRLFNSSIKEINFPSTQRLLYSEFQDGFRKNEFNLMAEAHFFVTRHLGFGLQFTYQLNKLYVNPDYIYDPSLWITTYRDVEYLRNYQFGLLTTYHLN